MNPHNAAAYGEMVGGDYDLLYPESHFDTAASVTALAGLAGTGRSFLEFGIGTGRLALPMLERGFDVAGIEGSDSMISQLAAKPRSDEIEVVKGDFTRTRLDGRFALVALVFNAIFGLPSRDAQLACFRNAAHHLERDGCFVVEAYVLRPQQLGGDWSIWPRSVQHGHVELQLSRYDPATNLLERTLVHLREEGLRFITVSDTYAWPGELDLLARAAGLELRSRTGGWADEPFDPSSHRHISVYGHAAGSRD